MVALGKISIQDVVAVAGGATATVPKEAWRAVDASRQVVEGLLARKEVAYGITTGFGEFAHVRIDPAQVRQLQRNLILSHAVGVGEPLPDPVVRAMILIRANTLVQGYSGVRRDVIEALLALLDKGVIPVVPSQGSVGSSGDLAPLAHIALCLIGEGKARLAGKTMPARTALAQAGLTPLVLEAKEGIALVNGTQMMAAIGCLAWSETWELLHDAEAAAAMSIEALLGSVAPFGEAIHALRPHPGQAAVAANLRVLTAGSQIVESHIGCDRVQDAYSLRCTPQVLGAVRDTLITAGEVLGREINSVTDNPLVFPDGSIVSQGNFHGEPLALQLDFMAIAVAEIASLSERRTERLVNPDLSEGLRPFLVERGGLNSGFMIAQYVAAALVSENKVHAHPASVDSIPTSANKEDHNSMGSIAALKLRRIVENTRRVIAIELLCAAQSLDFRAPLEAGRGSQVAHKAVRSVVPRLEEDRVLSDDVERMTEALRGGAVQAALRAAGVGLD